MKNLILKRAQNEKASAAQLTNCNVGKIKTSFSQWKKNWASKSGVGYAQKRPMDQASITYFKCDQKGHYANKCLVTEGASVPSVPQTRRDLYHICLQLGYFKKVFPTQQKGTSSDIFAITAATPPVEETDPVL